MDALLAYESSESEGEAPAASAEAASPAKKPKRSLLPSAADLFAAVSQPAFLNCGKAAVVPVQELKRAASVSAEDASDMAARVEALQAAEASLMADTAAAGETHSREKREKRMKRLAYRREAQKTTSDAKEASKKRVGKILGKDKVKAQRLKGQSLGGETTRWKSEEEMKLRQQFD